MNYNAFFASIEDSQESGLLTVCISTILSHNILCYIYVIRGVFFFFLVLSNLKNKIINLLPHRYC